MIRNFFITDFIEWLNEQKIVKLYSGTKVNLKNNNGTFYFPPEKNLDFEKFDEKIEKIVRDNFEAYRNDLEIEMRNKQREAYNLGVEMQRICNHYNDLGGVLYLSYRDLYTSSYGTSEYYEIYNRIHELENKREKLEKESDERRERVSFLMKSIELLSKTLELTKNHSMKMKYNKQPKNRYILAKIIKL